MPDFIVIGAMKSGTTTLYNWLAAQPDFTLPTVKEPNFFSEVGSWKRGPSAYARLFANVPEGHLTGEASVSCTDPQRARMAAERIAQTVPEVRLVYLVRDPIERLRSHYRHEVQRGRESRSLGEALRVRDNPYLGHSLYYSCLEPYLERFPAGQICVVKFEDLVADPAPGWSTVLRHVGAADRPRSSGAHNITSEKRQYTQVMLTLWQSGLWRPLARLPQPLRRIGKALLTRDTPGYADQLRRSLDPVPYGVADRIWDDISRLEAWLGWEGPLWRHVS